MGKKRRAAKRRKRNDLVANASVARDDGEFGITNRSSADDSSAGEQPSLYRLLGEGEGGAAEAAFQEAQRVIHGQLESPADDPHVNTKILFYSYASLHRLPGYASLDYAHSRTLTNAVTDIQRYLALPTLTRPFNFLLLASPGSGKSQLVKSVANRLGESQIGYVRFNMATMQSKDDLGRALDAARNVVVDGKVPLVFLDEFDSHEAHYALLLPVLWDGELDVGGRTLKLIRTVFFLAGSRSRLPEELKEARNLETPLNRVPTDSKLVDLFSRVNGTVIEVPSLASIKRDPRPDKVVIAMSILRHRFPQCEVVPWGLLAFIGNAHLRYDARSIATFVDLLAMKVGEEGGRTRLSTGDVPDPRTKLDCKAITKEHLAKLPFSSPEELKKSSLAFHFLHPNAEVGLVELWRKSTGIQFDQALRHPDLDTLVGKPMGMIYGESLMKALVAPEATAKPKS